MTKIDLFKKCALIGDLPKVQITTPVRHSTQIVGQVVKITSNAVGVQFNDLKWITWFSFDLDRKDSGGHNIGKRSHYIDELELINENEDPLVNQIG